MPIRIMPDPEGIFLDTVDGDMRLMTETQYKIYQLELHSRIHWDMIVDYSKRLSSLGEANFHLAKIAKNVNSGFYVNIPTIIQTLKSGLNSIYRSYKNKLGRWLIND